MHTPCDILLSMTAKSKYNLEYVNSSEQRTLSLEDEGFPCVQAIFRGQFRSTQPHLGFHRHPGCLEMSLCVRGSLTFECEGKVYRPLPGMIFVTQPRDLHHLTHKPKGMRHYGMLLRLPRAGETLLGLPADESAALVAQLRNLPHRLFAAPACARAVFDKLFAICDTDRRGPSRRLAIRAALLQFLCALPEASAKGLMPTGNRRLVALVQEIQKFPERRYCVEDLANRVGMSESILTVAFKKLTGFSPYAFVANCRLQRAREEIVATRDSFATVATRLGYSSSQHLARQFKSAFGQTMGDCRASIALQH